MLPEVLGSHGYQTHCVGKTHFYPQRTHLGFDSLESYEGLQNFTGRYTNDYFAWLAERSNGRLDENQAGLSFNSWIARPSPLPEEFHNNSWVASRAIEFIKRRDPTRPFFLNISFHRPHPPIDPPQTYWDEYKSRDLPEVPIGDWSGEHAVPMMDNDGWHGIIDRPALDRARRGYFAQIAHIDNQIGRVQNFIARNDVGPTAIVFTSDHGEMLGDHHLFRKSYAYEGSARVPLIVSVPGRAANDHICEHPAILHDVYATILDIADVDSPSYIEGRSLLPALSPSQSGDFFTREFVQGEHSECYDKSNAMQFIADGKEKYIWFPVTGREQLFDLKSDPQESHDLAGGNSNRLAAWRRELVRMLAERPDGLSDGKRLIPGTSPPSVRAALLENSEA